MPGIHTILHPTDFSENSRPAFQTACALARDAQATLLVLHVMMPSSSPLIASAPPDPRVPAESQPTPTKLPWPEPSDPRIRVEHRLAEGDAAEEILRVSAAVPCDLIVMGTHGRTGLGRLLTGSVAEEVLRKADCPVMVVKTPLHATPGLGAETIASPGAVVDVRPLEQSLVSASTRTLIHTSQLEVIRLIVRAGQEINRRARRGNHHPLPGGASNLHGLRNNSDAGSREARGCARRRALHIPRDRGFFPAADNRRPATLTGSFLSVALRCLWTCFTKSSAADKRGRIRPVGVPPKRSASPPAVVCRKVF